MTAKKSRPHGIALSNEIRRKMKASGISVADLAPKLGCSYSYLTTLLSGARPWDGVKRDVRKQVAEFLDIPVISMLMLAEMVEPSDFFVVDSVEDTLDRAFDSIKSNKTWGCYCTSRDEWNALSVNIRILMALLFEKATESEIIEKVRMIQVVRPT